MAILCGSCNSNPVLKSGDICSKCAKKMDPFAIAAAGLSISDAQVETTQSSSGHKKRELLANETEKSTAKATPSRVLLNESGDGSVDTAGSISPAIAAAIASPIAPSSSSSLSSPSQKAISGGPVSSSSKSSNSSVEIITGVAKNVVQDTERRGITWRWFRCIFKGANFAFDRDITEFQVFPDFSGQTLNAAGNISDQVIVYGKIKFGMISENNDVEVYGRRNPDGTIVASEVKNVATGATARPSMTISRPMAIGITLALFFLLVAILSIFGPGIIVDAVILALVIIFFPLIITVLLAIFSLIFSIVGKAI